jgi:hypothetical protein
MRRTYVPTFCTLFLLFQAITERNDNIVWIIVIVAVALFLIIAVIVIAVVIFFIMRRRSKAQSAPGALAGISAGVVASSTPGSLQQPETARLASPFPSAPLSTPNAVAALDEPALASENAMTVDLSRTIAIAPEAPTAPIIYGSIKFVSGALAGQQFDIKPDGCLVGRDSTLSQIVIPDPRISKRHVWIGVRDGRVTIADQGSRNGTFVNDPKSKRVTETVLNPGDTVILGESDVARFEYQN